MKIYYLKVFIIFNITTQIQTNNSDFIQCKDDTQLKKDIADLVSLLKQQIEEKRTTEERLRAMQDMQRQLQQAKQKEQAAIKEQIEKMPWYQKYTIFIAGHTLKWTTQDLIPRMMSILTSMIAQKLVQASLGTMDNVTGSIPVIGFRFGEVLTLNEEARANNALLRTAQKDPTYKKLTEEIDELRKEVFQFAKMEEMKKLFEFLRQVKEKKTKESEARTQSTDVSNSSEHNRNAREQNYLDID